MEITMDSTEKSSAAARPAPALVSQCNPRASAKAVGELTMFSPLQMERNKVSTHLRDLAKMYAQRLHLTAEEILSNALKAERNASRKRM
jgi:hypothetical protein